MYAGDMARYITWQNFALCLPLLRVVHSGRPNIRHRLAGYIIKGAAKTKKEKE
jgi:hypothetical protein